MMSDVSSFSDLLRQSILLVGLFGGVAVVVSQIAWRRGFFLLPDVHHRHPPLRVLHLCVAFSIFLIIFLCLTPLVHALLKYSSLSPLYTASILQLVAFLFTMLCFWILLRIRNRDIWKKVIKDDSYPYAVPLRMDLFLGCISWVVAFPVVACVSQIVELCILMIFHETGKDQLAIQYLKMALSSPGAFAIALFVILIGAPFLEEFLFRGVLQTWLRKRCAPFASILISSFFFAFFHLAPAQGISNFSLFFSLFTFALYLGFIYEKQRSLFSNIALHFTFNAISVMRIVTYENV